MQDAYIYKPDKQSCYQKPNLHSGIIIMRKRLCQVGEVTISLYLMLVRLSGELCPVLCTEH